MEEVRMSRHTLKAALGVLIMLASYVLLILVSNVKVINATHPKDSFDLLCHIVGVVGLLFGFFTICSAVLDGNKE
jgi:SNF family Na+-dependent transporter